MSSQLSKNSYQKHNFDALVQVNLQLKFEIGHNTCLKTLVSWLPNIRWVESVKKKHTECLFLCLKTSPTRINFFIRTVLSESCVQAVALFGFYYIVPGSNHTVVPNKGHKLKKSDLAFRPKTSIVPTKFGSESEPLFNFLI